MGHIKKNSVQSHLLDGNSNLSSIFRLPFPGLAEPLFSPYLRAITDESSFIFVIYLQAINSLLRVTIHPWANGPLTYLCILF